MTERTFITTPFNAGSTAADVMDGVDLTGRRAIVTGASSGIGIETARALALAGAEVTLAVRDLEAGRRTAKDIGTAGLHVAPLELADLDSVEAFVAGWDGPLHILVNNAGVSGPPQKWTSRGWETQFAVNHLGHFALATGLRRALAAAGRARVVSLSSVAHLNAPVDFEDLHFRARPYEPLTVYGQSKTATALFAVEANTRWAGDGITANTLHPGAIWTNLARHMTAEELANLPDYDFKTPQQGAATSVLLAASPLLEGVGGRYFEDGNEARPHVEGTSYGVAAHALDPEAATRLWQVSLDMLTAASRD